MFYSWPFPHYSDVRMGAVASQITSFTIVYSTVYSDADQRKHQSSESLAYVRGIHRGPVNSPHKGPVTRKMFPFDDIIMIEIISFGPDSLRIKTWFGRKKYPVVKINPSTVGSMHTWGLRLVLTVPGDGLCDLLRYHVIMKSKCFWDWQNN